MGKLSRPSVNIARISDTGWMAGAPGRSASRRLHYMAGCSESSLLAVSNLSVPCLSLSPLYSVGRLQVRNFNFRTLGVQARLSTLAVQRVDWIAEGHGKHRQEGDNGSHEGTHLPPVPGTIMIGPE